MRRLFAVAGLVLALSACASVRPPLERRTTQGPGAHELWTLTVLLQNGREPTFDERRHWEDRIDLRISEYLREHPEFANTFEASSFRFYRQSAVGQTKEQVLILLGAPLAVTTDAGEMEKLARRFWPALKGNVTEGWAYPLGWTLYFAGQRVVDITQYLEGAGGAPD